MPAALDKDRSNANLASSATGVRITRIIRPSLLPASLLFYIFTGESPTWNVSFIKSGKPAEVSADSPSSSVGATDETKRVIFLVGENRMLCRSQINED